MATHRISFWEVTATNGVNNSKIKFGIAGALQGLATKNRDGIEERSFEQIIAESIKRHAKNEEFYENYKYCARTKNKEKINLGNEESWPYGDDGKERIKGYEYIEMNLEAGIDHYFNYSYNRNTNKQYEISNQHQLRNYRIMLVFPKNSTKAYAALESISGNYINSIFEKHISKIVTEYLGNSVTFSLKRILDADSFIIALSNYEADEIEMQVDKKFNGRKGKTAIEKIKTGLTSEEAKDLMEKINSIVREETNFEKIKSYIQSFFKTKVEKGDMTKAKIRLIERTTNVNKTIDLSSPLSFIDISFDPSKQQGAGFFWDESSKITELI